MALGDYTLHLQKPLGIILQERNNGASGVRVKELVEGGAASASTDIVAGDVLLQINEVDVSSLDFDTIMDMLISLDPNATIQLTLSDGLGTFDMPKNVLKQLKSKEDAFFVDAVVRRAVRELRKNNYKLGDLLNVEMIIGAGVQTSNNAVDGNDEKRGMVRFFAIFSTDGVSSYSCNVSATGVARVRRGEERIDIVALSAAKDEGLGQTFEFVREMNESR